MNRTSDSAFGDQELALLQRATTGLAQAGRVAEFDARPNHASFAAAPLAPADASFRRDDVPAILIRALTVHFPVVRRLVGDESFLAAASRFVLAEAPELRPQMHFWQAFPHYLRTLGTAACFEYLADLAELEAACTRAQHAPDATPVDARALLFLSAARLEEIGVILHPSVSLVASRFPIVTIWQANQTDDGVIDQWGPEAALVARPVRDVNVHRLPSGGLAFMRSLAAGATISAAVAAATATETDDEATTPRESFELDTNLTALVEARIVVGFSRVVCQA